jgi:hypothetical protein
MMYILHKTVDVSLDGSDKGCIWLGSLEYARNGSEEFRDLDAEPLISLAAVIHGL